MWNQFWLINITELFPQIMEINSIKNNFPFVMYHKSWIDNMWRMLCTILEYQVYICTMVHVNVSCESL